MILAQDGSRCSCCVSRGYSNQPSKSLSPAVDVTRGFCSLLAIGQRSQFLMPWSSSERRSQCANLMCSTEQMHPERKAARACQREAMLSFVTYSGKHQRLAFDPSQHSMEENSRQALYLPYFAVFMHQSQYTMGGNPKPKILSG